MIYLPGSMMKNEKLTKSVIKQIVKECLVEILSEGIGAQKPAPRKSKETSYRKNKKEKYVDDADYGEIPRVYESKRKMPRINTNITNDSVLNEILADTAKSTLKEQMAADTKSGMAAIASQGDQAAKIVANSNPEDIFGGDAASKWSQLAFFDQK